MNKLISKIVGACLGLSLATGVGVGVAVGQNSVKEANASSGTYTKITATSSLTTGDKIILATEVNNVPTEGVTGGNTAGNNRDALHSGTESEWAEYTVNTEGSGWTLYDSSASKYIGIGSNYFQYVDTGATLYTDSNGYLLTAASSGRVLVINTSGQNETSRFVAQSNIGRAGYTPYVIWKVTSGSAPVAVSSISLSSNSETIKVGKGVTLTPTISPSNATNKTIAWTTSDSNVATVANGEVTGVAAGNATITAIADENNNGTLDSGEKSATCSVTVQAIQTIDATVAEAITAGASLQKDEVTEDLYNVTGYVVSIEEAFSSYGNMSFTLSDTKVASNSLICHRIHTTSTIANDVVVGAKVSVSGPLKNYNGTLEVINHSSSVITVLEAPTDVYPEPDVIRNSTLAALWADTQDNNKQIYEVTGTFSSWYKTDDYDKTRGRMYVKDSSNIEYLIYGCTANSEALVWSERNNVYQYTEQTDFLTNELTKDIAEGYVLTLELTRCDYNGTKEAHGIVKNVVAPEPEPVAAGEWVLENIANLTSSDVFVIVGNNDDNYAMSNDKGTSSAPSAIEVTIANDKITSAVSDNMKWTISGTASSYTFHPNGDSEKWLYCTNTNNGVRVGTNDNKTFTIENGYLKNAATTRYVGIYNSQDWRCYTSINSNIEGQTFAFYKYVESTEDLASDYADLFLETLSTGDAAVCQVTQSGEVQTVLSELVDAWEMLADEFDKLGDDKSLFTEGQADEDGTNIQKALALYDYIATKYNTQLETTTLTDYNFMGRTITPASNVMRLANVSDSAAVPAIVVVIALATVTTGAYFFLRKKKEN